MPEDADGLREYMLSWKSLTSVGKDANLLIINIVIFGI